jgi:hypothetical protein
MSNAPPPPPRVLLLLLSLFVCQLFRSLWLAMLLLVLLSQWLSLSLLLLSQWLLLFLLSPFVLLLSGGVAVAIGRQTGLLWSPHLTNPLFLLFCC